MSDTADGDDPSERERRHRFVRRVGIAIGLVTVAGMLVALFLESITVFFLVFASILWTVFLRGIAETIAKYTPIPVRAALALVMVLLLGAVVGVGFISGPNIAEQYNRVTETVPKAVDRLQTRIQQSPFADAVPDPGAIRETLRSEEVISGVTGIFAGAFGLVGNTVVIFFVGLYLAIDPARYRRGLTYLFPIAYRDRANAMIEEASYKLGWWLAGRVFTMSVIAIATTIGLALLGIPLAIFIGLLSGLLAFVPVIGPVASSIPAMLMAMLKGPIYVLYVAALYLGIQIVESYLLTPIVEEKAVEIPPALLIMMQVLTGLLTGLFGLLLATPMLVILIVIVKRGYIEDALGDTAAADR